MSIRILLADDHNILREGLRTLLEQQDDVKIVGEAEDGLAAITLARKLQPEVIIMDVSLPLLSGIEAARQIMKELPGTRIIALSMHSDKRFVTKMLSVGARGYLRKDCASEELSHAIQTVRSGQIYLSPRISINIGKFTPPSATRIPMFLSIKELDVLKLVAEGKTTKQIAFSLDVSEKTIEKHRQRIMEKLDLHSVAELTKFAIKEGLTSLES